MNCRQRAGKEIDESIFEEICDIIFDLIPQGIYDLLIDLKNIIFIN